MHRIFFLALVLTATASAAEKSENVEATRLFAEARAARAAWHDFPGFTADIAVNIDGKVKSGKVAVDAHGKVQIDIADEAATAWAQPFLSSIVGHRLPADSASTPCYFPDTDDKNPLGRAVAVDDDEFHSSYRVRDRQIIVVNRTARNVRFTITVLENQLNAEKHFLPVCYAVSTWNDKTNQLVRSEAFHHGWQRVGRFDLPRSALIVSALSGKQEAKELTLSNLHLNSAPVR